MNTTDTMTISERWLRTEAEGHWAAMYEHVRVWLGRENITQVIKIDGKTYNIVDQAIYDQGGVTGYNVEYARHCKEWTEEQLKSKNGL